MKRFLDLSKINESVAREGFHVIPNFFPNFSLAHVLKQRVRREASLGCIFNPDMKRKQIFFKDLSFHKEVLISEIMHRLSNVLPKREARDFVFLLSERNCKDQKKHADYNISEIQRKVEDDGVCGGYPMGCILALEDNTYFNVWKGSINFDTSKHYAHERLCLKAGDLLLFRADLIHSGAAFVEDNLRVHCFLDRKGIERDEDYTCFMDMYQNLEEIKG